MHCDNHLTYNSLGYTLYFLSGELALVVLLFATALQSVSWTNLSSERIRQHVRTFPVYILWQTFT